MLADWLDLFPPVPDEVANASIAAAAAAMAAGGGTAHACEAPSSGPARRGRCWVSTVLSGPGAAPFGPVRQVPCSRMRLGRRRRQPTAGEIVAEQRQLWGRPEREVRPAPPGAWAPRPGATRRRVVKIGIGTGAVIALGGTTAVVGALRRGHDPPDPPGVLRLHLTPAELVARIVDEGPLIVDPGLAIVDYPVDRLAAAAAVYDDVTLVGLRLGLVALYPRDTHLGCRLPYCPSSDWWEDPCHGSKYNRVGEKRDGPAPRGLARWPLSSSEASGRLSIIIDRRNDPIPGPPLGTDTTRQQSRGPHCT